MSIADEIAKLHELRSRGALAGVCGGLARLSGVESWVWRLLFVLGLVFGGFTLFAYIVFWIFAPREEP